MEIKRHVCTDECNPETMDHVGRPDEIGPEVPESAYPEGAQPLPVEEG